MAERLAKKLLLIGWDGADWQIINPLLERGEMPALERIISQGVMGNFASMNPMISPMLWTTMATGRPPYQHGICAFYEPDPESERGVRLVSSTSRKCKAFWNILSQQRLKVHTVGWFASHPAEPINGVCISEHFAKPIGLMEKGWPILKGSVSPAELASELSELRLHPQEISLEQLEYFVPTAKSIDQTEDSALTKLALQLAECSTNQALATWILETQDWDMVSVYFNTLDHICHEFMYFHPPRMSHIPEELYERYRNVVEAMYRFHDMMLGALMEKAGDDATVMIVSDHGYQSGAQRPVLTPDEPAGPVAWHRPYGIIAMKGPNIRKDELIFGGRIVDLTPTILTLFGLPIGSDMTGRPLVQAFERPIEVQKIPSWDEVEGPSGQHSDQEKIDPYAEQAAMDQLISLGYIDPIPAEKQEAIRKATTEYEYNLGRSLVAIGKPEEAVAMLENVHRALPNQLAIAFTLADCYQKLGRIDDCRRLVDYIAAGNCFDTSLEDSKYRIVAQTDILYGILESNERNYAKAIEHFKAAEKAVGRAKGLHTQMGNAYIELQQFDEAGRAFATAAEVEPDDPVAHHGLAIVHLQAGRSDDAIDAALRSIEILYHQPRVHYHLALAFRQAGEIDNARHAMQVALQMDPSNKEIAWQLAELSTGSTKGSPGH